MYCGQCGTQLNETVRFCTSCGKSIDAAPLLPLSGATASSSPVAIQTMNNHIRILAILWAVYSGFRILTAVWTIVFSRVFIPIFRNVMPHDNDANLMPLLRMMSGFYVVTGIWSICAAALGFWAAWALLKHEQSGRVLALVIAFVSLISIPFGTALGVYTLVIMLSKNAEQTYNAIVATA
jgi:zinc ribbon protein